MIFIIMGVSGSGKSTVGNLLANKIKSPFYDADDFHSRENKEKMRQGIALTDADRAPWLKALSSLIEEQDRNAILACSALKKSYRDELRVPGKKVVFIYLKGEEKLLEKRLSLRKGHYAGPSLLQSQLQTLQEPDDAFTISIKDSPDKIVDKILQKYGSNL
ncbi:MAG: gluconokinase [Thermodesulfobacteriota bacterium]